MVLLLLLLVVMVVVVVAVEVLVVIVDVAVVMNAVVVLVLVFVEHPQLIRADSPAGFTCQDVTFASLTTLLMVNRTLWNREAVVSNAIDFSEGNTELLTNTSSI